MTLIGFATMCERTGPTEVMFVWSGTSLESTRDSHDAWKGGAGEAALR
jgi:hypothetical protein